MLAAVEEALRFARGKSLRSLASDRMLALALIKDIEIAGEAAARTSQAFRDRHPEIPWKAIVATRNRLIHGYYDVDLEVIWRTVQSDLPPLAAALKSAIARR